MSKTAQEERLYKLYDTLAKGDLKKELILRKCIVFFGLTRVGKSTVFNFMNGKEMIGKRVYGKVVYEPLSDNNDGFAEVSASALSKTLIPNVIKINEDTCMIDTAGFRDKRNHIGVFSVNYMIKVIFEMGQLFSFILVISKDQIGTGGHQILDTLFHFINLFDYENMNQAVKESLLASVGLIVTKAAGIEEDIEIIEQLEGIIDECSQVDYRYDRKQACLELLSSIVKNRRIQFFRKAVLNKNCPKSEVLENFANKLWRPFNLPEAKIQHPNILVNSFLKEYDGLLPDDKTKYQKIIQDKLNLYKPASEMIKQMINYTLDNIFNPVIDYSSFFSNMKEFLEQADEYTDENRDINRRLAENGMTLNKLELNNSDPITVITKIGSIISFTENISQISNAENNIDTSLREYMETFRNIFRDVFINVQQLCCKTKAQETILVNFAYVLLKGFRQFTMICEIDPHHCNDAHIRIKDHFNGICDKTSTQIKHDIIIKISDLRHSQKITAFPKISEFSDYMAFCTDFNTNYAHEFQDANSMHIRCIKQQLFYCELLDKEGKDKYQQSLKTGTQVFESLLDKASDSGFLEHEIVILEESFICCIKTLAKTLINMRKFDLAISLLCQIDEVSDVCRCYERKKIQITETNTKTHSIPDEYQVKKYFNDFSDYCVSHGRIEQGIVVMQEYMKSMTSKGKIKEVQRKIASIIRDKERSLEDYAAKCEEEVSYINRSPSAYVDLLEDLKAACEGSLVNLSATRINDD